MYCFIFAFENIEIIFFLSLATLKTKGDVVEFNVSTDRRDKLQRAVSIKLISVCLKNGQTREVGVVTGLKEGFGFIKCADQDLSIFFHFSEVLEQVRFQIILFHFKLFCFV